MSDSEKALAILNILETNVAKERSLDTQALCSMAAFDAVDPNDEACKDARALAWRTIHKRLTDAEELYGFAVRCFIERAYHAAKT